jgi:hypothetical protein
LKFQKGRFVPDLDYINEYEKVYRVVRKSGRDVLRERKVVRKVKELKEREKELSRPEPTATELFGWQKIVYEKLPTGIFKTRDIYNFKDEFFSFYPENRNVEAKIRQILQQLRDIGLIRHLGIGKWEKK